MERVSISREGSFSAVRLREKKKEVGLRATLSLVSRARAAPASRLRHRRPALRRRGMASTLPAPRDRGDRTGGGRQTTKARTAPKEEEPPYGAENARDVRSAAVVSGPAPSPAARAAKKATFSPEHAADRQCRSRTTAAGGDAGRGPGGRGGAEGARRKTGPARCSALRLRSRAAPLKKSLPSTLLHPSPSTFPHPANAPADSRPANFIMDMVGEWVCVRVDCVFC
jgi:hypothetical protein